MFINSLPALDFNDVLIEPNPTSLDSRSQVDLIVKYTTPNSNVEISGIPIITANMSSISTFSMAKEMARHNAFCALHKHYTVEDYDNFFNSNADISDKVFFTIGMHDYHKLESLSIRPKLICIDVANGYMESFIAFVEKVRNNYPDAVIMAGNVVTEIGATNLYKAGADIVKVGIGSGSVCHTRLVAGVGVPQVTAILNTIESANKYGGLICSDGGITIAADFCKAYVAGAHFVMAGGIFSGHDECEMDIHIDDNGNKVMKYYGMSSGHAMNIHNGGMNSYRSSEGKLVTVKYKGKVEHTLNHIYGGLRSAGTYINSDLQTFYEAGILKPVRNTHNKIYGE